MVTLFYLMLHARSRKTWAGHRNCGHTAHLKSISHVTVRIILEGNELKPNKIRYYLERKDLEFNSKMHDVLLVYKQIEMCFDKEGNLVIDMDDPKTVIVSSFWTIIHYFHERSSIIENKHRKSGTAFGIRYKSDSVPGQ